MTKLALSISAAALALAFASPASAQIAGTYNGNSADGAGLQFTVSTDSNTGLLAVTGAGVGFSAPCKNSSVVLNTGWGYGMTSDIVNRKVTNNSNGSYFDITFSLHFSADGQSATGTIETISPDLDPTTTPPKKALYCVSPKQTLTLAYAGPTARQPAVHGPYLYDRKGRIIGQMQH